LMLLSSTVIIIGTYLIACKYIIRFLHRFLRNYMCQKRVSSVAIAAVLDKYLLDTLHSGNIN
jgi:ABC-type uncharacterized transport system permease subunit